MIAPNFRNPFGRMGKRFINSSGEEIPAHAVMRIVSSALVDGEIVYTVAKPNTTFYRQYLVNGPFKVASGSTAEGWGAFLSEGGPVLVSAAAVLGDVFGPKSAQWTLEKHYYGFLMQGASFTQGSGTVAVAAQSVVDSVLGKTDASHGVDSSGTVSIWAGAGGSEADTTMNITGVYNRFGSSAIASGQWVWVQWNGLTPYLTAARCA